MRRRVVQALGLLFNFLLPWALYRIGQAHMSETHALMLSAAGPAVWSLVELAWSRRINAWSVMVLAGIGFGLAGIALGGSPKILLFRESLFTGLSGMVFVVSALIGRPLFYWVLMAIVRSSLPLQPPSQTAPSNNRLVNALAEFESWTSERWFVKVMTLTTLFVGLVGVAETIARAILIFSLPSDKVLLLLPAVSYGASALLVMWAFLYFAPAIRRGRSDAAEKDFSGMLESQNEPG